MGKRIVISAVNFTSGGPLSILIDCLRSIKNLSLHHDNEIIVLVHKKELVAEFDFCTVYEYPEIKSSWSKRLKFEFKQSRELSEQWKPDLWIALHDITPNVNCKQVVYCHNPSPFYKVKLSKVKYDITFALFCLFYKYLYKINIRKNKYVIVQQQWLRKAFEKKYHTQCIVAYPAMPQVSDNAVSEPRPAAAGKPFVFFFPAFARVAKNFEVLLEAASILSAKRNDFELWLTIGQGINKYADHLYDTYKDIAQIKFIGVQPRERIFELYQQTDAMVFPSELETWGLPITEYKAYRKPMLLADLQYAHETAGNYPYVKYFDQQNSNQLAALMELAITAQLVYDEAAEIDPPAPFCRNWDELTKLLFAI